MKRLFWAVVFLLVFAPSLYAEKITLADGMNMGVFRGHLNNMFTELYSDDSAKVIGVDTQAWDADLDTFALISPTANVISILSAADYAAIRTLLSITDDQTAAEVSVVTTAFGTNFANDASHDTVQKLMDLIDDFSLGGGAPEGTAVLSTGEIGGTKFLREDGDGTSSWQIISGGGDALVANPLSQFAATTSAQLAGVVSDETGTGAVVLASSPTLITPALGTPSSIDISNASGTLSVDIALDTAASTTSGQITYNSAKLQVGNGSGTDYFSSDTTNATTYAAALGVDDNYVTDAQLVIVGNTSGTNTGDQTTVSGNAGTATALAANGGNCAAGSYALGVDASGAVESCTDATTEINSAIAAIATLKITGEVQATVNVLTKGAAYTLGTDESTEVGGSLVIATAAMVLTLPAASAGYSGCFMAAHDATIIIQLLPVGDDELVVDGVSLTAATAYASDGSAGDKICYIAADATYWYITSEVGTWSE